MYRLLFSSLCLWNVIGFYSFSYGTNVKVYYKHYPDYYYERFGSIFGELMSLFNLNIPEKYGIINSDPFGSLVDYYRESYQEILRYLHLPSNYIYNTTSHFSMLGEATFKAYNRKQMLRAFGVQTRIMCECYTNRDWWHTEECNQARLVIPAYVTISKNEIPVLMTLYVARYNESNDFEVMDCFENLFPSTTSWNVSDFRRPLPYSQTILNMSQGLISIYENEFHCRETESLWYRTPSEINELCRNNRGTPINVQCGGWGMSDNHSHTYFGCLPNSKYPYNSTLIELATRTGAFQAMKQLHLVTRMRSSSFRFMDSLVYESKDVVGFFWSCFLAIVPNAFFTPDKNDFPFRLTSIFAIKLIIQLFYYWETASFLLGSNFDEILNNKVLEIGGTLVYNGKKRESGYDVAGSLVVINVTQGLIERVRTEAFLENVIRAAFFLLYLIVLIFPEYEDGFFKFKFDYWKAIEILSFLVSVFYSPFLLLAHNRQEYEYALQRFAFFLTLLGIFGVAYVWIMSSRAYRSNPERDSS